MAFVIHPIRLYFIERSGIVDAFRELLKSYKMSTQHLNINTRHHADLIDLLEDTIPIAYPRSVHNSSVELEADKQRINMYYRMFGLKIQGKEDLIVTADYNRDFEAIFKDLMVNLFQGIHDSNDPQEVRMVDRNRIVQLLNQLRGNLLDHSTNIADREIVQWVIAFERLIYLLGDEDLGNALNLTSDTLEGRALQLGQKIGVQVSNFDSFYALSQMMAEFLLRVENTQNWDAAPQGNVEELYRESADFFRTIANSWAIMDPEVRFSEMALAKRIR